MDPYFVLYWFESCFISLFSANIICLFSLCCRWSLEFNRTFETPKKEIKKCWTTSIMSPSTCYWMHSPEALLSFYTTWWRHSRFVLWPCLKVIYQLLKNYKFNNSTWKKSSFNNKDFCQQMCHNSIGYCVISLWNNICIFYRKKIVYICICCIYFLIRFEGLFH